MKVRLNLATSPLESHRQFALGAALVGTVAVVALGLLSWHAYSVRRAERALRAEITRLEKQMEQLRHQRRDLEVYFNQADIRKMRDRSGYLNGLIEHRSFPWTKIFAELEHILPDGVRVVSISPKMNEGRIEVKLVVGATGDESKLKFLRALEASKEFSRIQLLAETRPNRLGEVDKVYLELVAAWYATT